MIYNIAIIFNSEINKEIYTFYDTFKNNLNLDFGLKEYSIPHATIIKFEAEKLNKQELDDILKDVKIDLEVDFSGITFLPSHSSLGCWIEIPILKNQDLIEIQSRLIEKLKNYKILSGINNRFRPHITFCKTNDSVINLKELDYNILRKKGIKAKLVIGSADENFEFYEI